jgi:hypothetical protein
MKHQATSWSEGEGEYPVRKLRFIDLNARVPRITSTISLRCCGRTTAQLIDVCRGHFSYPGRKASTQTPWSSQSSNSVWHRSSHKASVSYFWISAFTSIDRPADDFEKDKARCMQRRKEEVHRGFISARIPQRRAVLSFVSFGEEGSTGHWLTQKQFATTGPTSKTMMRVSDWCWTAQT